MAKLASLAFMCLQPVSAMARVRVTPVQQVVQMLTEMKSKGEVSMAEEKKTYETYAEWVDDRTTDLGFEIKTTNMEIEKLIAFIDKADSDAATLGTNIAQLLTEITQNEADQKAATEQRETEHSEYVEAQEDLAESVDALSRAIQTLKSQDFSRPQALVQLQQMASKTAAMRRVLGAFLEETASNSEDGAPAVAAYEFQAGGIIEILEKLLDKFKDQLSDTESAEANEAHAYNLEVLHLGNIVQRLNADREGKSSLKGKTVAESASAKGRLTASRTDLKEGQALLAETKSTFASKSAAFESNQQIRKEELEAIGQAVGIISESSVAGSYASHINLAQIAPHSGKAVSLLQESSRSAAARSQAKAKAVALLKSKAEALKSSVLVAAAASLADSPFGKVIDMIESLIAKLKEEAASEADHKSFCDEELAKNKLKREEKAASAAQLQAEVEKYGAEIADMADQIKTLSEEQASLAAAMSESTKDRQAEKAENEATISDAAEAQVALKRALVILREFYSKQEGASFVQQVPEMEAYKGMQSSKGGVVGMLEVIESDFLRLETETKAAETQAAAEYAEFMSTSKATAKSKHDREFKLSLAKDQAEFEVGRVKEDLGMENDELDKANQYYDTLKPQCLQVHVSYEERAEQRKQEVEALKEAYKILDGM